MNKINIVLTIILSISLGYVYLNPPKNLYSINLKQVDLGDENLFTEGFIYNRKNTL